MTAADYIQNMRDREAGIARMNAVFDDFDVLALPTTPIVAPTIEEVASADGFAARNALLAAQHLDRQFLRSLRDQLAAQARQLIALRTDAVRPPRRGPEAVSGGGGSGEGAGGVDARVARAANEQTCWTLRLQEPRQTTRLELLRIGHERIRRRLVWGLQPSRRPIRSATALLRLRLDKG